MTACLLWESYSSYKMVYNDIDALDYLRGSIYTHTSYKKVCIDINTCIVSQNHVTVSKQLI